MFTIISYSHYLVIIAAAIIAGIRFRLLTTSLRCLAVLLMIIPVIEACALVYAYCFKNNYIVYTIYSIVEFTLLCLYFHFSVDKFRANKVALIILVAGVLIWIANLLFTDFMNQKDSAFVGFEIVVIVAMAAYALYRLLLYSDSSVSNNLHFTILIVLIFNWLITFLHWGMEREMGQLLQSSGINLFMVVHLVNIIFTGIFCWTFIVLPQFKKTD